VAESLPTELLEAIDRIGFHPWSGVTFRHTAPHRNGLSGAGARIFGGRWNPPGLASTLYLAEPRGTCVAEFLRMAQGQARGPQSFLPRTVHQIVVTDLSILDLRGDGMADVGLDASDLSSDDWRACQLVGEAAHFLGAAGLIAPSATGQGHTIAAFETRASGHLEIVAIEQIEPEEVS
jgi:RES domain-containing protein